MTTDQPHIAVIGAGSWGTALAWSLGNAGHSVVMWARRAEAAHTIQDTRHNPAYLAGTALPENVSVTHDLGAALRKARVWVIAVPSQHVRSVAEQAEVHLSPDTVIVSVAKGIENGTLLTTSGVLRETFPDHTTSRIGVLYGPSHAEEVVLGHPTSVVSAFPDLSVAGEIQALFMTPRLRVYTNSDLIGVEIAGSVKNVIALSVGVSDGYGWGDNAKAALVTRGLAEMTRLGLSLGADPHTFAGLAGVGDLVVTCFSRHSRNRGFGERIGAGQSLEEAAASSTMVVEGVATTKSVRELAQRQGIEMPITEGVYQVLFNGTDPVEAMDRLMTREPRREAAHLVLSPEGTEA